MKKKVIGTVRILIAVALMACGIAGIMSSLGNMQETKENKAVQKQSSIDELKQSYDKLSIGMSYEECVNLIGSDGELFSETESEYFGKTAIYMWKPGDELFTGIEGQFENGNLSSKTWVD